MTKIDDIAISDDGRPTAVRDLRHENNHVMKITDEDMMLAIGPRWSSYRGVWQRMRDTGEMTVSFSLAALFLQSSWLAYRRLYKEAVALFAAEMAIFYIHHYYYPNKFSFVAQTALTLFVAIAGKALVIDRARGLIEKLEHSGISPRERETILQQDGGVSVPAAIGASYCTFMIWILSIPDQAMQEPRNQVFRSLKIFLKDLFLPYT